MANLLESRGRPFELLRLNIVGESLAKGMSGLPYSGFPPQQQLRIVAANIDVDLYEATLSAMHQVAEHLVVGGIMILEDVAATPSLTGALAAAETFLASPEGKGFLRLYGRS